MSDIRYWIGLSLVPEVGPVISRKLLSAFGSPENIFQAGMSELEAVKGLSREKAQSIRDFGQWDAADRCLDTLEKKSVQAVRCTDAAYPAQLREMPDAPIVLYMKGGYVPEDRFSIAVVGSRRHSHYGEAATQSLCGELSLRGFTIVSGMARGIDTLAHKSALASGGRTVAVLGSGIDVCYPPENRALMERIGNSGCVMTEFPPGTMPNRENFPRRNRIISGLSLGVLVIEATADSGSLITAQYALEQNREVFALPGNITSPHSEGTNELIRQGARMVLRPDDIIRELAPQLKGFIREAEKVKADMTEEEGRICAVLSREPKHIDSLSRDAGVAVNRLLNLLLSLELKGLVRQSHGKRFYLS